MLEELRAIQQTRMSDAGLKQTAYHAFMERYGLSMPAMRLLIEELHKKYPPPPIWWVLEEAIREVQEELGDGYGIV